MGSSMVVHSQSKIITFTSDGFTCYLVRIPHKKFHESSSSHSSAAELTIFLVKCIGIIGGSKDKSFSALLLLFQ